MTDEERRKKEIEEARKQLRTLRDEVKVRTHLLGMEARDRWDKLNTEADRLLREAEKAGHSALESLIRKLRQFSDSIKPQQPHKA